jgi:acetate---CoA ligase (ADP-forming)
MNATPNQVHALLNPMSIAIVGASENSRWSRGFVANLTAWPMAGRQVHMVNPARSEAFGQICYPSISDIPSTVDHACIVVRAARVPSVLEDCVRAGVRSATVVASGFDEAGPSGVALGTAVRAYCQTHEISLVGPNCYGFNNYTGTYLSRYSVDVSPGPGSIALTVQSGLLGAGAAESAYARGIKLRYVVSSGNELVTDSNDYFGYFVQHPDVRVLGGVLERIPDPSRFAAIALQALDTDKAMVVLKIGRSEAARRVAVAHTGAVTGGDAIVEAFLRDLGVVRVDSLEELVETAAVLADERRPRGRRTVYFGFSGGGAELFADQADATPLEVCAFSDRTRNAIAEAIGLEPAAVHNPLDMTADGAVAYKVVTEILAESGEFDIVVSQGQAAQPARLDQLTEMRASHESALTRSADRCGISSMFLECDDSLPGPRAYEVRSETGAHYLFGRNGVRALGNAAWHASARSALLGDEAPPDVAVDRANAEKYRAASGSMTETQAKQLLSAYGIPTTHDVLVSSRESAEQAAETLGYPLVMKVAAAAITHKSDVGGVRLGLTSRTEVGAAFEEMMARVARAQPGADVSGVILSAQCIEPHLEFFAGVTVDPQLGPAVVTGLGGLHLEVLRDVSLGRPPLNRRRAMAMLDELRSARLLDGLRGAAPFDRDAYVQALCRLGQLAVDLSGSLDELDINPLFVLPRGRGVLAVDAVAVFGDAPVPRTPQHPEAIREVSAE